METDQRYLQHDSGSNRDDGCTAVAAVLVDNHLLVANVGDSRAVLSRNGKGVKLYGPGHSNSNWNMSRWVFTALSMSFWFAWLPFQFNLAYGSFCVLRHMADTLPWY